MTHHAAPTTAAQRLALAEAVTVNPLTGSGRSTALKIIAEGPPEAAAVLRAGARWLELGCGVAGMLLATACQYPDLRGVGVDIAADLVEVASRRAEELGVDDRIRFETIDARIFTDSEPFDIVFWSQSFFPSGTREAALANAYARLRPDGLLLCPIMQDSPPSPAALEAELRAAGFVGVRTHRGNSATTVIARPAAAGRTARPDSHDPGEAS